MTYNFEWPKTAAHFAKLYTMKSFDLQEIRTDILQVGDKKYTQGIKFFFHEETDPIEYGKDDGQTVVKAEFKRD